MGILEGTHNTGLKRSASGRLGHSRSASTESGGTQLEVGR